MTANKIARRPKLEGLKGASTIPTNIRIVLNIPDGVLLAPYKEFCYPKLLINNYLQSGIYVDDASVLYGAVISTLDDISKLTLKEVKDPVKNRSAKMVFIDDDCILLTQAPNIIRYCKEVKLFSGNTQIRSMFTLEYAKAIKTKRREAEIQDDNANLSHKGQLLMFNAADFCYYQINDNLRKYKGKRKMAANEGDHFIGRNLSSSYFFN